MAEREDPPAEAVAHGTAVALPTPRGWAAVLLRGPAGAGKSDLALRLIEGGGRLICDDQCRIVGAPGPPVVRPPAALAGLIEVRGVGILPAPARDEAPLALIVDLVAREPERMPEPRETEILGHRLPTIAIAPFGASAPAKIRLFLRAGCESVMTLPVTEDGANGSGPSEPGPPERPPSGRRLVLVSGLSGAGRSIALKHLEDQGYEAIDNLPLDLLEAVISEADPRRPIAIGIDIRSRRFAVEPLLENLDRLTRELGLHATLVFLDGEDAILMRRYTETRRRHPLAPERPLADGIAAERQLLAPLRARADLVIDTSELAPKELGRLLKGHLGGDESLGLALIVTSFSYRLGLPREADLVLDVRFLANPHYDPELRPLDGRDPRIVAYVAADPGYEGFLSGLQDLLAPLVERYEAEGKSYLTIAFGCTGGRHRSVVVAEAFAAWLGGLGRRVTLLHRDLERSDAPAKGPARQKERDSRRQTR